MAAPDPAPRTRSPSIGRRTVSARASGVALACVLGWAAPRLEAAPNEAAAPSSDAPRVAPRAAVSANPAVAEPDFGAALRAYQDALSERRLDAAGALSVDQLREIVQGAEAQLALGRRDEAIARLGAVIESARFAPLEKLEEGRAAVFFLADALGRAGAHGAAAAYLRRLLASGVADSWARRAVSRLVDFALDSGDAEPFSEALAELPGGAQQPWAGDVAYLRGALHERAGRTRQALAAYAEVPPKARFWSQATYRAGLLEVEQGRLTQGERLFCQIADPRQTPRLAPLFGGNDFFQVRDMSRLALGRVAHEQYRFDDAGYYYHLVPGDSDRLPEALYESATSRYEAKDYAAAQALIGELRGLERRHVYEDEVWLLDAYVDLAQCEFPRADAKLKAFLQRYEPVLATARYLQSEPRALRDLMNGGQRSPAPELDGSPEAAALLGTTLRVDPGYGRLTRQLAALEHQSSGLRVARLELQALRSRVLESGAVVPRSTSAVVDSPSDRAGRLDEQLAAARRLLREAAPQAGKLERELGDLKQELLQIEGQALAFRQTLAPEPRSPAAPAQDALSALLERDAELAVELERAASALSSNLSTRRDRLAREALSRLEQRLTRLVRRARAGRIETVLGRKRAVEVEIEALSQGFLPRGAVDSLDAARYLADDEEYWPLDGEDWEDEYIGGEGLR